MSKGTSAQNFALKALRVCIFTDLKHLKTSKDKTIWKISLKFWKMIYVVPRGNIGDFKLRRLRVLISSKLSPSYFSVRKNKTLAIFLAMNRFRVPNASTNMVLEPHYLWSSPHIKPYKHCLHCLLCLPGPTVYWLANKHFKNFPPKFVQKVR